MSSDVPARLEALQGDELFSGVRLNNEITLSWRLFFGAAQFVHEWNACQNVYNELKWSGESKQ